ncbi:MAG: class I SAM-dependent RNA methyltransferase [Polyangiaceae bacterium]|nr:class I SAM-dependent RNA methyltransferase [Polyangiaceae bacterium]
MSRECGGCPWIDQELDGQRLRKLDSLRRAFADLGVTPPEPSFVRAGSDLGYRNRLRLRIDAQGEVVFFNPKKLTSCAVLVPGLAHAVATLQALGPLEGLATAEHLELRVGDDGSIGLCMYAPSVPTSTVREALTRALPEGWRVGFAQDAALPTLEYFLEESDAGCFAYSVPLSSFVQVNSAVSRALVAAVRGLVRAAEVGSFNDLFCGSGNFSLPLLADGLSGASFEVDAHAIAALQRGAAALPGQAALRHHAEVADARNITDRLEPRELLLANPPRAGLKLDAKAAPALASRATRVIALCSCSPSSLARDLALLLPCGFELRGLSAFDMFPHTAHLETLAWLERS